MVLRGADVRGEAPAEVREAGFEAMRALMEAWYGESMSAAEARDLADSDADTAAAAGARFFLVEREGEPAACCTLLGHGGIGQVEEVYAAAATAATGWPARSSAPRSRRRGSAATTS